MSPTKCKENMHSASQLFLNSLSILFLSDIFYRFIYYYDLIYSKNTCYYHHKAQNEAKTWTIQPKVGLNIANLTNGDGNKVRTGISAGIELEYHLTDMFSLLSGVVYSMQGCKNKYYANTDLTNKLDYINIPIIANVYVAKGLAVKLGVQPGFNIRNKTTGSLGDLPKDTYKDSEVRSFDFSIPMGLSYEYHSFVVDARYNWGLTNVIKNMNHKNSVFQFTLGYKFKL